jgi:hypothetical protein
MTYQEIGGGEGYHLIAFDKAGRERQDDPDGIMSSRLTDIVRAGEHTDIFVASHGWKGDISAAIDQYDRWFGALLARTADRQAAKERQPGFNPLLIGLHWPSLPFGDEKFGDGSFAVDESEAQLSESELVDSYVTTLGDAPEIRDCLTIIANAVKSQAGALQLPPDVADGYVRLNDALGLSPDDEDADHEAERAAYDPNQALKMARMASASFDGGGWGLGNLPLLLLRQLSFWTMKNRGRAVGETGFHPLLRGLMEAGPSVRVHLMGHSFGCVAMSSAVCGPKGQGRLPRGVNSVMLVQGALSLWTYCPAIALAKGKPGYYMRLLRDGRVNGPVAVTRSVHDTAVGRLYPLASKVKGSVDFAPKDPPRFGGLGSFGAQGLHAGEFGGDQEIGSPTDSYVFAKGKLYNIEASRVICKGGGMGGAHSDIDGPEVAHLWWELARNAA